MNQRLRYLRAKLIVLRYGLKVATTHKQKIIKRLGLLNTIKNLVNLEELIEKPKNSFTTRNIKSLNHKYF